jgi:hypothetical protein
MKTVLLSISILALFFSAHAQTTRLEISQLGIFSQEDTGIAKIYFNQEIELKDIIINKAQTKKEYPVWRVQIYMGSAKDSRNEATSVRNNFKTRYPEIEADWIYHAPYFKVHAGNFKTRIEAESFRLKIMSQYPKSWIVKEVLKIN